MQPQAARQRSTHNSRWGGGPEIDDSAISKNFHVRETSCLRIGGKLPLVIIQIGLARFVYWQLGDL